MTAFEKAVKYVIENEGTTYEDVEGDRGGCTKYGISLRSAIRLPQFGIKDCEDIKNLTEYAAKQIYYIVYWKFDQIANDRVATKMFDIFVNLPPGSANIIYQRAAVNCGQQIKIDGIWGHRTISAINAIPPDTYLLELRDQLHTYYQRVVEHNPSQAKFVRGWLNRADRLPEKA